jgi:hypothetical protein
MAAGDVVRDAGSPRRNGNMLQLTGSMEIDEATRTFALMDTKSRIVSCQVTCADGSGAARIKLNENSSAAGTDGSISAYGNHVRVATYQFVCNYV